MVQNLYGEIMKKKKKKLLTKIPVPMTDYHGGTAFPTLANGLADPAGSYTGVPIMFEMPEQDADDL